MSRDGAAGRAQPVLSPAEVKALEAAMRRHPSHRAKVADLAAAREARR